MRLSNIIVIGLSLTAIAGCAEVKPWERGYLAKNIMAPDSNPEFNSLSQHAYTSRESGSASVSSSKSSGGGCGCY